MQLFQNLKEFFFAIIFQVHLPVSHCETAFKPRHIWFCHSKNFFVELPLAFLLQVKKIPTYVRKIFYQSFLNLTDVIKNLKFRRPK